MNTSGIWNRNFVVIGLMSLLCFVTVACGGAAPPPAEPTAPALAKEIVFYGWDGDEVPAVLEAFQKETGVKVTYLPYEEQEEALSNLEQGEVYDVVVLDNYNLPGAINKGLLAKIDYSNVPNFKNISANFRDLSHDPDNTHTIPFNWGTTFVVVRSDLAGEVTSWADFWTLAAEGQKVAIRDEPRDAIGSILKSLGYSTNSENEAEVNEAIEKLKTLSGNIILVDGDAEAAVPLLASGEAVALIAWAEDYEFAQEEGEEAINYVFPTEGALLWGDNLVVAQSSPNKYTAELFLDFLMRPEINAEIVNETYYATANESAREFIEPGILDNVVIFPPDKDLQSAEVLLPLGEEGTALYDQGWVEFLATLE